jgi:DNA-binding response OmpR family regulator
MQEATNAIVNRRDRSRLDGTRSFVDRAPRDRRSEVFLVTKAASFGIVPAFAISLGASVSVVEADQSAASEEPVAAQSSTDESWRCAEAPRARWRSLTSRHQAHFWRGEVSHRRVASAGSVDVRDLNFSNCEISHTARILVVEDDHAMRRMIVDYLEDHNMRGLSASGRQELVRHCAAGEPDLIVLDLRFDQEDGLDLLREIRSRSDVPVIIVTGDRRDEIDRVVGLELGADDYITKPFVLRELLARIRAVLRRQEAGRSAPQRDPERRRSNFGGWQLDRRLRRLVDPAGSQISLTKGEYALLTAFLDAPQRPLSREQLLQATRVHEDIFDRSIDVQILRLRRKLEPDPSTPQMIRTERGVGYTFTLPVQTE